MNKLSGEYMKRLLKVLLFSAIISLCGCTGQWTDDPKNWKRAFGDSPPEGVTIVHSFYRRTKYLPREEDWAFEFKLSSARRKLVFENLKLKRPTESEKHVVEFFTKNEPSWFIPKPMTNYDTWVSVEKPGVLVAAFEDKESGHVFVSAAGL